MAASQTATRITALYGHLSRDSNLTGGQQLDHQSERYLESYAAQHT